MARWAKMFGTAFVMAVIGTGCVVQQDDASRFREALPQSEDVALKVPSSAHGGATTKSAGGIHIATNGAPDSTARYYRFTRDMTDVVDLGTAIILGAIWTVANSPPTTIDSKHAVWGPGQGNALDPIIWRFTVTEVGDKEYDYVLDAKSKIQGGDFVPVLTGADKGYADVLVTHDAAGAGSVEISGIADIDESKDTQLEDVHLLSRWSTDGSGRADLEMKGGDLPFTVDASECWSTSFARVYYKDTVDYEPASGEEAACSLASSTL
jgi:hypothetical protein